MRGATLTVGIPNFGGWADGAWKSLLDVARCCEAAGVDRIVVNDHVVMGSRTEAYVWGRFPTAPDGPWLEPMTTLAAIASATTTIRLATGVLIAPLRPATVLAKTAATLDVLSGGRLDLGVGVGWQAEEYAATGLDFADRGRLLTETIAACRELWSRLPASYSSVSTSFDDTYCSPQPTQSRLPVWFSGTLNARNLRRIVDLGDGWIPIMGATIDDIRNGATKLKAATDRTITIQAPARIARADDKSIDLGATMDSVPDLLAAGATDIYVNIASIAASPALAPDAATRLVESFRKVTT